MTSTPDMKELKRYEKKLREIQKLEEGAANGDPLQKNQIDKIHKKGDILERMKALQEPLQEHGWTRVGKQCAQKKTCNQKVELAVEWLPCHARGLQVLVHNYGVDTASEITRGSYMQPHLLPGQLAQGAASSLPRGFVNVCHQYVHATLGYVNPPSDMDLPEAEAYIQNHILADLKGVADTSQPEIIFDCGVRSGKAGGGREVFRIASSDHLKQRQTIMAARENLLRIFNKHGFRARIPSDASDQIHITIRDERYETLAATSADRPKIPSKQGTLAIVFDKLAVTPAAECSARHCFRRQSCGATLCLSIFCGASHASVPKCFVQGTYFQCVNGKLVSLEDIQEEEVLQGYDGGRVVVVEVQRHEVEWRKLVWLEADGVGLMVTSDHRVVVRRRGELQTIPANHLCKGSLVATAEGEKELSSVKEHDCKAEVVELKFFPDIGIETFFANGAFLTQGSKFYLSRRAKAAQPKGKSGSSIPDTSSMVLFPSRTLRLANYV